MGGDLPVRGSLQGGAVAGKNKNGADAFAGIRAGMESINENYCVLRRPGVFGLIVMVTSLYSSRQPEL